MSADAWVLCPVCNQPNPDSDGPDDEYYGAMRVDWEIWNEDQTGPLKFRLNLWCTQCDANATVDESSIVFTKLK